MRIPRLFVDVPLRAGDSITLGGSEAHYLQHVLRCRPGGTLTLFNGTGGEYRALIAAADRGRVRVQIETFSDTERESSLAIHVGLGITKRDAMDTAIQKATELGATEIFPLVTEFTDIPKKSLAGRLEHWRQITRSTCEQCERNRVPPIHPAMPLDAWLEATAAQVKLVAHPGGNTHFDDLPAATESVALLTGPEGGFSAEEISRCEDHGFTVIGLGPRILRADTAPTVLLTLIQARFGDMSTPMRAGRT